MFRALAALEGTLRILDPGFDVIAEARQLAEVQRIGLPTPAQLAGTAADDLLELLPALRRMPRRLDQLGRLAERAS